MTSQILQAVRLHSHQQHVVIQLKSLRLDSHYHSYRTTAALCNTTQSFNLRIFPYTLADKELPFHHLPPPPCTLITIFKLSQGVFTQWFSRGRGPCRSKEPLCIKGAPVDQRGLCRSVPNFSYSSAVHCIAEQLP